MAICGDCGRPIDYAIGPEGQIIKLDKREEIRGEHRFSLEFEEFKPLPRATPLAADREFPAPIAHEFVCGQAFV